MGELRYKGYLPGLDVLRGIAIASVLLYHGLSGQLPWTSFSGAFRWFDYLTTWGSTGVELFFVLSGFLITGIVLDAREKPRFFQRFYFNRALRILPAYVLILVVLKGSGVVSWKYVLACMLYVANMARLVGAHNSEYGAFWSLAVEEQFYLLWPWIARRFSLPALLRGILVYCACSLLLRGVAAAVHLPVDFGYKLWGNADWLFAGAAVAIALRCGALNRANIGGWMAGLLGMGALTLPVSIYLDLVPRGFWQNCFLMPFYRVPFVLVYVAALLWVVSRNQGYEQAARLGAPARIFAFLGYISYGLYLVHPFVFQQLASATAHGWLGRHRSEPRGLLTLFLLASAISIAVATLSRRYFEEFFLQMKQRSVERSRQRDLLQGEKAAA